MKEKVINPVKKSTLTRGIKPRGKFTSSEKQISKGTRKTFSNGVNEGILNIREKGSNIFREGVHMLPGVSLMISEGVLKSIKD